MKKYIGLFFCIVYPLVAILSIRNVNNQYSQYVTIPAKVKNVEILSTSSGPMPRIAVYEAKITYIYEYKGKNYEFSNKEELKSVKPGDITEVMISPSDPSKIITLDKRKNALGMTVMLTSFSILIGVIFLLDYKKDKENKMG